MAVFKADIDSFFLLLLFYRSTGLGHPDCAVDPSTGRALVHWMNQHLDYFYRENDNDKSCFRAGLAARACPNYRIFDDLSKPGGWVQMAHVCRYEGEPLITHYCRGKLDMPDLHPCDQVPIDWERRVEFVRLIRESL